MLANAIFGHADNTGDMERQRDSIIPRFHKSTSMNQRKSKLAQRDVFDEFDAVELLIPGDKNAAHIRVVSEDDKRRWPQAWARYQSGVSGIDGLPLEKWYEMQSAPGLVAEMKALNIHSVESLAKADDGFCTRFQGGQVLREKARKFLNAHNASEENATLKAEKDAMRGEMEALKAQMAELLAASGVTKKTATK